MATVTFEKAQRWYPGADKPAVPGISLEIGDGEFMVLVGPSGCGKSTTLRMLAGLEEVNEGKIFIGDRDITHMPPKDRDIAMVFQNYALYPHMSVADNMGFALKMAKVPAEERRKRVADAAKILQLEDFLETDESKEVGQHSEPGGESGAEPVRERGAEAEQRHRADRGGDGETQQRALGEQEGQVTGGRQGFAPAGSALVRSSGPRAVRRRDGRTAAADGAGPDARAAARLSA